MTKLVFGLSFRSIVVVFCAYLAASTSAGTTVFAAPGDLDPTFAGNGRLTDWAGSARAVAIQPDGMIVVAGTDLGGGSFALARYNPDGSPDTSFGGGDGKVITDIGFSDESVNAVVLQPDGKIVAVGTTWDGGGTRQWGHFSLVRYNPDGSLDLTFGGGDGIVVTEDLGTGWVGANSAAIQSDGKIVAAGSFDYFFYDFSEMIVIRYNADGSLDETFGEGDGKATIPWGPGPFGGNAPTIENVTSIAILPDGKIAAAGYTYGFHLYSALVRLNSNGSLDSTFGSGGAVFTDIRSGADVPGSVVIQPDGRIVTAGSSSIGSNDSDFALVRYSSTGPVDNTFGTDGKVVTPISGRSSAQSIAVQSDGKILVSGTSDLPAFATDSFQNANFALARYNTDGSLDTTFGGGDGKTIVDFNNAGDYCFEMAIDANRRAVVVGTSGGKFAIARFLLGSGISISGRVTSPSGQILRNATVVMTDAQGTVKTSTTSSFGIYSFADVESGQNLTLTVRSKRYRFTPRTIQVVGDLSNIDLVGQE